MVRKTIYITESQAEKLAILAKLERVSESELVRRGLDLVLQRPSRNPEVRRRAMGIIGIVASGDTDVSERHDEYLAEIYSHDQLADTQEP